MFNPQPKPVKAEKKKRKKTRINLYLCSDGSRLTQMQISGKLCMSYKKKHFGKTSTPCEGCDKVPAQDNSHIISQRRLKQLHKAELIFHPDSYCSYCRDCHQIWESFKSGRFTELLNYQIAIQFIKEHDPETHIKLTIYVDKLLT